MAPGSFDFGVATTCDDNDTPTEIWYTAPPRDGQKEGNERSIICRSDDFAFAEARAEKCLCTSKKRPLDIQFMFFVKSLLKENLLPEEENNPKQNRRNRADRIKKVKETVRDYWKRWVNGENATRRDVEKDHGWKESILPYTTYCAFRAYLKLVWSDFAEIVILRCSET